MFFRKTAFLCLIFLSLTLVFPSAAQEDDGQSVPVITAANIDRLTSVQYLDFESLTPTYIPASGIFALNADGSKIVTFANRENEAPLSQAILWGYNDNETPTVNRLDNGNIIRILSAAGNCLAAGYPGYYAVWKLDPAADAAELVGRADLLTPGDTVINLWWAESPAGELADGRCDTDIAAEVIAADGSTYILRPAVSPAPLVTNIFAIPGQLLAGRVGRIQPPLAITVDFENHLYRWDMNSHQVTATLQVDDYAIFGIASSDGNYFIWQRTDQSGLHWIDFAAGIDRRVATYENIYYPYLILPNTADVIIGIDPTDRRGSVDAWKVENGDRLELGNYRVCRKVQPDLVKLSADGTTVVIGCDTGLDVWRVGN